MFTAQRLTASRHACGWSISSTAIRSTSIARCWRREMLKPGLRYSIAELLPHGPAFVLLDALHDYGDEHASCHVDITPQSLFFEASRGDRKSTRLNSSNQCAS